MSRRDDRHNGIRHIVRTTRSRTQQEIAEALANMGFHCTQATVSRDVAEMGLRKAADGAYVLAEDLTLQKLSADMVKKVVIAGNLVVVSTLPGTASGVAAAIDAASMPEILGTVAGDDTILVICQNNEKSEEFFAHMTAMAGL